MDEIFNDWVVADDAARVVAHGKKDQGTTIMLTWTPIITRWQALAILLLGARAGRLNIASIKVLSAKNGEAKLLIKQQMEKETTDKEFGDAIDRGRTMDVDARALSDTMNVLCPHQMPWDDCPDCRH